MRLILLSAQNVRREMLPLSLSEFAYIVAALMLKRIQYTAMMVENPKAKKLMNTKRNLE